MYLYKQFMGAFNLIQSGAGTGERGPKGDDGRSLTDITVTDNNNGSCELNFIMNDGSTIGPITNTLVSDTLLNLNKLELAGGNDDMKLVVVASDDTVTFSVDTTEKKVNINTLVVDNVSTFNGTVVITDTPTLSNHAVRLEEVTEAISVANSYTDQEILSIQSSLTTDRLVLSGADYGNKLQVKASNNDVVFNVSTYNYKTTTSHLQVDGLSEFNDTVVFQGDAIESHVMYIGLQVHEINSPLVTSHLSLENVIEIGGVLKLQTSNHSDPFILTQSETGNLNTITGSLIFENDVTINKLELVGVNDPNKFLISDALSAPVFRIDTAESSTNTFNLNIGGDTVIAKPLTFNSLIPKTQPFSFGSNVSASTSNGLYYNTAGTTVVKTGDYIAVFLSTGSYSISQINATLASQIATYTLAGYISVVVSNDPDNPLFFKLTITFFAPFSGSIVFSSEFLTTLGFTNLGLINKTYTVGEFLPFSVPKVFSFIAETLTHKIELNTTVLENSLKFVGGTTASIKYDDFTEQIVIDRNLSVNNNKIKNVSSPIDNNDACNKLYCDNLDTATRAYSLGLDTALRSEISNKSSFSITCSLIVPTGTMPTTTNCPTGGFAVLNTASSVYIPISLGNALFVHTPGTGNITYTGNSEITVRVTFAVTLSSTGGVGTNVYALGVIKSPILVYPSISANSSMMVSSLSESYIGDGIQQNTQGSAIFTITNGNVISIALKSNNIRGILYRHISLIVQVL